MEAHEQEFHEPVSAPEPSVEPPALLVRLVEVQAEKYLEALATEPVEMRGHPTQGEQWVTDEARQWAEQRLAERSAISEKEASRSTKEFVGLMKRSYRRKEQGESDESLLCDLPEALREAVLDAVIAGEVPRPAKPRKVRPESKVFIPKTKPQRRRQAYTGFVDSERNALDAFMSKIDHPILTAEGEVELAKRYERGDMQAKDTLIEHNYRLVADIAFKSQTRLEPLERIQEGMIGLIRAAELFDYRKGYKFSTYATWWIKQGIQRGTADKANLIRVPVHQIERLRSIRDFQSAYEQEFGESPSVEEIGTHLGRDPEDIQNVLNATAHPTSLDAPLFDGSDDLYAVLPGSSPSAETEVLEEQDPYSNLRSVLERLPDADRELLELRYGLGESTSRSVRELAALLGVGPERIRQRLKGVLRTAQELAGLTDV